MATQLATHSLSEPRLSWLVLDVLAAAHLVMAQTGNTREGKAVLEAGLKGLAAWLEGLPGTGEEGELWDPGRRIANGISELLKMVQVERPDWQGIATNVEWLGKALEEEIENVQDDLNRVQTGGNGGD